MQMAFTPYNGFSLRSAHSANKVDPMARLKQLIGFSEEPVQDAEGYWTIGYGERLNEKPGGPKPYATISEPMADDALRYRVEKDPSQFRLLGGDHFSLNQQRTQPAMEFDPANEGQSPSEPQNNGMAEMKPYEPSSSTVLPGQMIQMFTFGGVDIIGAEKEPTKFYVGGGRGRQPAHLNIPNSIIVFNRIPEFSGDSTFGERITVVNGQNGSVGAPSGNYFVSNVVPNGVGGVPGSGNSGVSVTVSAR